MLSSSQFNKFKNLGDFIVPLARYNLHDPVISGFLTDQLIKETEKEILNFLQLVLKEITGENDLTWSLIDAVDILAVLGKLLTLFGLTLQGPWIVWGGEISPLPVISTV